MNEQMVPNPFVGPRSFGVQDAPVFFGRERELGDLFRLVIAERIVLLYSPSGAGKTSLLQAGLVPALEKEGFHVHPTVRVNRAVPTEGETPRRNRFLASMILSLGTPEREEETTRRDADDAGDSLVGYLDALRARQRVTTGQDTKYEAFIFDQFEEILTTDPASHAAREERLAFFAAVGEMLLDPNRWAVFSIREDYLAGLDPYRRPIPTRLTNHFRLDLLQRAGARKAISEPPRVVADVTVDDAAVVRIVENLSRVPASESSPGEGMPSEGGNDGIYVEPLHLQLVCDRLWDTLNPEPGSRITVDQIDDLADVDTALQEHYDEKVGEIASASSHADERDIRDWFEERLIIGEQGIRGQVAQENERSGGLDNATIAMLVDAKLVNKETRLKNAWYELSHDRMIGPVRRSNASWYQVNLEDFQRQARTWAARNEPGDELLGSAAWFRARRRIRDKGIRLRPDERKFLDQSRTALQRRMYVVFGGIVLIALVAATWWIVSRQNEDDLLASAANTWSISARNVLPSDREEDLDLGILLSAEAVYQLDRIERPVGHDESSSLFTGVAAQPYLVGPVRNTQASGNSSTEDEASQQRRLTIVLPVLAVSPDGRFVASWDPDEPGTLSVTGVPRISFKEEPIPRLELTLPMGGAVTALAFVPEEGGNGLLAVGRQDGTIHQYDMDILNPGAQLLGWVRGGRLDPGGTDGSCLGDPPATAGSVVSPSVHGRCAGVTHLLAHPGGHLVAGYANGEVIVWSGSFSVGGEGNWVRIGCPMMEASGSQCGSVTDLGSGPEGRLVIGYSGGVLGRVNDLESSGPAGHISGIPEGAVVVAIAPGNGSNSETVVLDIKGLRQVGTITARSTYQRLRNVPSIPGMTDVVARSGDPWVLFWGHESGQIDTWTGDSAPASLSPATGFQIDDIEISPDGQWLVTLSDDGLVQMWRTSGISPVGQPASGPVPSHASCVVDVTFDGSHLTSEEIAGATAVWDIHELPSTPIPAVTATPAATSIIDPRVMRSDSTASPDTTAPDTVARPVASPGAGAGGRDTRCSQDRDLSREDLEHLPASTPALENALREYGVSSLDEKARVVVYDTGEVALFVNSEEGWSMVGLLPGAGTGTVASVAVSHDGLRDGGLVALGFGDGEIRFWMKDDATWQLIGGLTGHDSRVTALRFDPAKHYLASGDRNGVVILWNLEPTEWIDFACYRAARELTVDEKDEHLGKPESWDTACEV